MEELLAVEQGQVKEIHPWLANGLSSVTYSATRGLPMMEFRGSTFESFLLPIANPVKVLK
jgi:hypothetical protein